MNLMTIRKNPALQNLLTEKALKKEPVKHRLLFYIQFTHHTKLISPAHHSLLELPLKADPTMQPAPLHAPAQQVHHYLSL